jgi:hypothetical protein
MRHSRSEERRAEMVMVVEIIVGVLHASWIYANSMKGGKNEGCSYLTSAKRIPQHVAKKKEMNEANGNLSEDVQSDLDESYLPRAWSQQVFC